MRNFIIILLFISFSCNQDRDSVSSYLTEKRIESKNTQNSIKNKNGNLYKNQAKIKADSLIQKEFGESYFSKNFEWNKDGSYANCINSNKVFRYFSEDLTCLPNMIRIDYNVKYKNEIVHNFFIEFDEELTIDSFYLDHLLKQKIAIKNLLNNKFKTDMSIVKDICRKNNIELSVFDVNLILKKDGQEKNLTDFVWKISPNYKYYNDSRILIKSEYDNTWHKSYTINAYSPKLELDTLHIFNMSCQ